MNNKDNKLIYEAYKNHKDLDVIIDEATSASVQFRDFSAQIQSDIMASMNRLAEVGIKYGTIGAIAQTAFFTFGPWQNVLLGVVLSSGTLLGGAGLTGLLLYRFPKLRQIAWAILKKIFGIGSKKEAEQQHQDNINKLAEQAGVSREEVVKIMDEIQATLIKDPDISADLSKLAEKCMTQGCSDEEFRQVMDDLTNKRNNKLRQYEKAAQLIDDSQNQPDESPIKQQDDQPI